MPKPLDYSLDPIRPSHYRVNKAAPYNAEPYPKMLIQHIVTPEDVFFHRNHGPIPQLDESHVIEVVGMVTGPFYFNVTYLKRHYAKVDIVATLQVKMKRCKLRWGWRLMDG